MSKQVVLTFVPERIIIKFLTQEELRPLEILTHLLA